jgi:eukaryotic-like serine/threonine-protein kinase
MSQKIAQAHYDANRLSPPARGPCCKVASHMAQPLRDDSEEEVQDGGENVSDDELLFDDATDWGVTDLGAGQPKPPRSAISRPPKSLRRRGIATEGDVLAGKYRVERLVSANGMTAVVHARHEEAEQRVVLKYLLPEVCGFPDIVARVLRGARAALQIRSEHAGRILDVGRLESGAPYFAMEFLRGWALSEVIRVRGPLPVPDAVDYVVQACEAVAEAHMLGFAHRNLNMSSVLLTRRPDGSPLIKVLDFGASESLVVDPYGDEAPMVDSKAFLESLPYTSPEQIRSANDIDARADVWAIGAILHELLAASPLYRGDTAPALMAMIVADPALPIGSMRPDVPPELEALILRCVEKERNARFPNVAELALALRPFAAEDGLPAIERISRMVGRSTRPPPLFSHSRALVHLPLPPPPPRSRTPVRPPPAPSPSRDRLIPIAIACAGVIGGAAVGAIVALKTTREIPMPEAALTSQAFAASPAAVSRPIAPIPQETATPETIPAATPPKPVAPSPLTPAVQPQPARAQRTLQIADEAPRRRSAPSAESEPRRSADPEEAIKRMSPRLENPFDDDRDKRVSQKASEPARIPPTKAPKDDLFDDVR